MLLLSLHLVLASIAVGPSALEGLDLGSIRPGETVSGTLPAGEPTAVFATVVLEGSEGVITLEAHSLDFDTVLSVRAVAADGPSGPAVEDDDGGIGTDSRVRLAAAAGTRYRLEVRPFVRDSWGGEFRIEVVSGDAPAFDRGDGGRAEEAYWQDVRKRAAARGLPFREARALQGLAWIRRDQDRTAEASELAAMAVSLAERSGGPDHPSLFGPLRISGLVADDRGDLEGARALFRRAMSIHERSGDRDDRSFAFVIRELAEVERKAKRLDEAALLAARSVTILENAEGPDDASVANALGALAKIELERKAYAAAEESFQRALAIREKRFGTESREVANTISWLGRAAADQGRHVEAYSRYEHALALREKILGGDHLDTVVDLEFLAAAASSLGRYEEARSRLEKAIAVREAHPEWSRKDLANKVNDLAILDYRQGRHDDAERNLRRALDLYGSSAGRDRPESATTISNLAEVLRSRGKTADSVLVTAREVAALEAAETPDRAELAKALSELAVDLRELGRPKEAIPHLERAVSILAADGGDADQIVDALLELTLARLEAGDRGAARRSREELVRLVRGWIEDPAVWRRSEALRGSRALSRILGVSRTAIGFRSSLSEIADLAARGLARDEARVGAAHPDLIDWLEGIVIPQFVLGHVDVARTAASRIFAIAEGASDAEPGRLARALNTTTALDFVSGETSSAMESAKRALSTAEPRREEEPEALAVAQRNLALLLWDAGDLDEARRLMQAHVEWVEARHIASCFGGGIPQLELAMLLDELALPAEARSQAERAVERLRGEGQPSWEGLAARALLEDLSRKVGAPVQNEAASRDLAATLEAGGEVHLGLCSKWELPPRPVLDAPSLLHRAGRHDYARSLARAYRRIPGLWGWRFGRLRLGELLADEARESWELGRRSDALELARESGSTLDEVVAETIDLLPERQAVRLAQRNDEPRTILFSGLLQIREDRARWLEACWESTIRHRALVLETLALRHASESAGTADVTAARDRLAAARLRVAALWVQDALFSDPEAEQAAIDAARREKEAAEEALARVSARFRERLDARRVGLDDVRAALPRDAALVEIVRVTVWPRGTAQGEPRYVALTLRDRREPSSFVDLGAAAALDGDVDLWNERLREAFEDGPASARDLTGANDAGVRLRQALWDPIARELTGTRVVFIVPDGSLHRVPFHALPTADGRYLLDDGPTVHVLSTGRDLVRIVRAPALESATDGRVLVLGDPDFDASRSTRIAGLGEASPPSGFRGTRSACPNAGLPRWSPLPGSRREAEEVAAALGETPEARLLLGASASEERFKREAPGNRVLHVATHGFFLQDRCASLEGGARGVGGVVAVTGKTEPPTGGGPAGRVPSQSSASRDARRSRSVLAAANPLLLSGLVLAGANLADAEAADGDDGILSAEELVSLDLRSARIVTLSACETGLGSLAAGEGVFGLRRALEIAGARAVLTSVWPVPDREAPAWMRAFYAALRAGPVHDATRKASLEVLTNLRREGVPTHPYLWAGFVAGGDWR